MINAFSSVSCSQLPVNEEWMPVVGYVGKYEVSNSGRVRSLISRYTTARPVPKMLSLFFILGYPTVSLSLKGITKNISVHILVAKAFLGEAPHGMEVCHKDGTRDNNSVENLMWGTYKTNASHRDIHGTAPKGERHGMAKLSESDVVSVMTRKKRGEMSKTIAASLGVSRAAISDIVCGRRWRHITRQKGLSSETRKQIEGAQ